MIANIVASVKSEVSGFVVCLLSSGVDSAVNLTASTSTTSPMNLAMPRLLSLREASNTRPTRPQPFTKPQQVPVADVTSGGAARSTWSLTNSAQSQRPVSLASKPQTLTSSWSFPANSGSAPTLRPRSSTSLTVARQLQPSTSSITDSIPPLRIARPQHLQAQMKQALNPGKLSVVRSTAASPLSSVTSKTSSAGGHTSLTSGLERSDGVLAASAAVCRDNERVSSSAVPPTTSKLHAAKHGNGDQSTLVALKLAVAERRHSNDTTPINTLKVNTCMSYYYLP